MSTILLVVIATDTGGYAVGARLGRHPMAPQISPKKTWEGMVGSVVLAGAVAIPLTSLVAAAPRGGWDSCWPGDRGRRHLR